VPWFGSGLPAVDSLYLSLLNPYAGIDDLVVADPLPALGSVVWWLLLGSAGCAFAAGQLRPAYLREADGRPRRRWLGGRGRVPPVGERPVLWKELHVERLQAYGRWVKALAILIAVTFLGTSLTLAGLSAWRRWVEGDPGGADAVLGTLAGVMDASWVLVWLIQWAMGLRAAASIAAERQRGTWDSLLLTPLEGREIVLGKIYGGIAALRGFAAALILGWTAGLIGGALAYGKYVQLVSDAVVVGAFMVVLGTSFSLRSPSATRAMTLTIVGWLAAAFGTAVLAGLLALLIGLAVVLGWLLWLAATTGTTAAAMAAGPPLAAWWGTCYHLLRLLLYAGMAVGIAAYLRTHFDRLAGRAALTESAGGKRSVGRRTRDGVQASSAKA
jgi:ABC-type transport system involved in multi-copper enzyme maturation permease subunit